MRSFFWVICLHSSRSRLVIQKVWVRKTTSWRVLLHLHVETNHMRVVDLRTLTYHYLFWGIKRKSSKQRPPCAYIVQAERIVYFILSLLSIIIARHAFDAKRCYAKRRNKWCIVSGYIFCLIWKIVFSEWRLLESEAISHCKIKVEWCWRQKILIHLNYNRFSPSKRLEQQMEQPALVIGLKWLSQWLSGELLRASAWLAVYFVCAGKWV